MLTASPRPTEHPVSVGRGMLRLVRHAVLEVTVVAAIVLFLFLAVGPRLLPYRTVTMLTGSMAPKIPAGAVAVDVREPVSQLRPGQVVSFHSPLPGHPVVTHRVVSVEHRDGNTLIRTRGDANTADDPWLAVVHGDAVWRVRGVVPVLGRVVRALRTPTVHPLVAWVLPALLLLWFLAGVWRTPRPAPEAVPLPRQRADADRDGGDGGCAREPSRSVSLSSASRRR